jgi:hypothetical protein
MSRLATRLVAVLVPVALLLPADAHAEKVVTEDAVGDAVTLVDESADLDEAVPAPDHEGTDVVRTAVVHGAKRLRVRVAFRALERDPFQYLVVRVRTPHGNYELLVERLGGKPITSIDRGPRTVDCGGLGAKVDLRTDTVTASVPTSCLDAPRWVQVGVGAVSVSGQQDDPELGAVYADDAHRDGAIRDDIATGPKVRRG